MRRLKSIVSLILLFAVNIWIVGCGQFAPSQFGRRLTSQNQISQPQTPQTNYNNLFSNNSNTATPSTVNTNNPVSQPQVQPNSCGDYSVKVQQLASSCGPLLRSNQSILMSYYGSVVSSCISNFNQLTPNTNCDTVQSQVSNLRSACADIFSDPEINWYSIPGGTSCQSAIRALQPM